MRPGQNRGAGPRSLLAGSSPAAELSGSLGTGVCGDQLLWAPLSQSWMRSLSVSLCVPGAWLCDQGRQTREPWSQPPARCSCLAVPGGGHASSQGGAPWGPPDGAFRHLHPSPSVLGAAPFGSACLWPQTGGLWLEVLVFVGDRRRHVHPATLTACAVFGSESSEHGGALSASMETIYSKPDLPMKRLTGWNCYQGD